MTEETLTPEQEYQREYYRTNKTKRKRALSERWHNDPAFRRQEQARARKRRGELRAEKAPGRFREMISEKRKVMKATRPPRLVLTGEDAPVEVYTTGSLGREVGRSARAIRAWLHRGVLPGATAYIGGSAYFSRRYCVAVFEACERLYYLDGRGDRQVLKRLVREELSSKRISYVPHGQEDNSDRVVLDNA